MNERKEMLVKKRGPEEHPKISTRTIIREIASHTNLKYDEVADVVYAFLHYVKYATLATNQKITIRNFGSFYLTRTKGRVYGKHVGAATFHPDRMKLALTSPLQEVDKWKSTQSIQRSVVNALDVGLRQSSMDLSVCVRIVDLVLTNKPIIELRGEEKIEFARQWAYATGASPLIPSVSEHPDYNNQTYYSVKFRIRGETSSALIFDYEPDSFYVGFSTNNPRDILFFPTGWASSLDLRGIKKDSIMQRPYGKTLESQCAELYKAYLVAKYGKKI